MSVPSAEAGQVAVHPSRALAHCSEYGQPRRIGRRIHQHPAWWFDMDGNASTEALRLAAHHEPNDFTAVMDTPAGFR